MYIIADVARFLRNDRGHYKCSHSFRSMSVRFEKGSFRSILVRFEKLEVFTLVY